MSNDKSKSTSKPAAKPLRGLANRTPPDRKPSGDWQWSSTDLQSALDTWQALSEAKLGPSPDEKQRAELRKLLRELKEKIKDFESES